MSGNIRVAVILAIFAICRCEKSLYDVLADEDFEAVNDFEENVKDLPLPYVANFVKRDVGMEDIASKANSLRKDGGELWDKLMGYLRSRMESNRDRGSRIIMTTPSDESSTVGDRMTTEFKALRWNIRKDPTSNDGNSVKPDSGETKPRKWENIRWKTDTGDSPSTEEIHDELDSKPSIGKSAHHFFQKWTLWKAFSAETVDSETGFKRFFWF